MRTQITRSGSAPLSLWEITLKRTLGRADFRVESQLFRRGLIDNGYVEQPITSQHAIATEHLPPLRTARLDHLIVVQAQTEGVLLLPSHEVVYHYPGTIRRV